MPNIHESYPQTLEIIKTSISIGPIQKTVLTYRWNPLDLCRIQTWPWYADKRWSVDYSLK